MEEEDLHQALLDLHVVKPAYRDNILSFLKVLQIKHLPTYEHSLRVGVLCQRAGEVLGLDPRALLWGGTLHDIGKALVDVQILDKTGFFSKRDHASVRPHVMRGYWLLRDIHPHTADLIVRHHRFQPCPYPKKLPKYSGAWTKRTILNIEKQARILALMDYYDALTRRRNLKFVGSTKTEEELRQIFYDHNPDVSRKIDKLVKAGVVSF